MSNFKTVKAAPARTLLTCALASCLMLGTMPALAQSTAATIRGQVTADSAPAAGATVKATNTATGLTRTVQVSSSGAYLLGGLPPGPYRLEVTAGGRSTTQDIIVQVGQTATMNLGLGGMAETGPVAATTTLDTVQVVAPALVETRTSEVATYVTQKQINALPQNSRNFLAFADIVPGVQFITGQDGSASLRSGAQSSNGTNVFIDGVSQKNYVLKGGITGQDSSRGNAFPQSAIGEYKVITSNYKAEYDQISSAAVTAVTKSGTNQFQGSFFWDYTNEDWRAKTPREERGGYKNPSKDEQYGASFGGPILQDRLHFFVAYEAKEYVAPREVTLGENVPLSALPSYLQAQAVPTSSPFKSDLYFGKLTWTPGDAHLFELTGKVRKESEITDVGNGPNTPSWATDKTNDETRIDLRYQFSASNWLNDAHLTYEDAYYEPRPVTIAPGYQVTTPDRRVILRTGGSANYQNKGQTGYSFQDDLTFTGWDRHTVKTGIKYKRVEVNALEQNPYNAQYLYDITQSFTVPFEVNFGQLIPGISNSNVRSNNKQFGIYVQDDWEVNDKLTLNLGLRWDYEETPSYLNYVTRPDLVAALRGWSNIQNTDYNIEDYISTGNNRSAFKGAWQPRLGFSYDLNADQRHVVFGGMGRSYDRNLFDYLALEQSRGVFPSYTYQFDTPGHPCTVGTGTCLAWDPAYFNKDQLAQLVAANPNLGGEINLINNDLKTPYSDQFSLGMRNSFQMMGTDWNSSASVVHVRSHDGIYFSLGNRWPDGSFRDPANPGATWGGQPWGQGIPGFGNLIIARNGIETRLNSLLLSLDKPYSRDSGWGVTVAYTFNDAKENRSNAANSDEHYLFDYPTLGKFYRSIGIPRHRLVVTGIYDAPFDITLSAKLVLASPTSKDFINCFDVPAGSTNDSNCFADVFTPSANIGFKQLDLAAERVWDTGSNVSFRVRADFLNVFNNRNYIDYDTFKGNPTSGYNVNFGNRQSDSDIYYPTRTFKLSFGLNW